MKKLEGGGWSRMFGKPTLFFWVGFWELDWMELEEVTYYNYQELERVGSSGVFGNLIQ